MLWKPVNYLESVLMYCYLQMTSTEEDLLEMDHYLEKSYRKTASLMSNGAKAIAAMEGCSDEVQTAHSAVSFLFVEHRSVWTHLEISEEYNYLTTGGANAWLLLTGDSVGSRLWQEPWPGLPGTVDI